MGKAKKEKARRKKEQRELSRKNSKRNKIITVGSLVGITAAALITLYSGKETDVRYVPQNYLASTYLKQELEFPDYSLLNIEDYIENREIITGNDPTRTLYIIPQRHKIKGLPQSFYEDKIIPTQIAIYRIIEYLHTQKNLELITLEGVTKGNPSDKAPWEKEAKRVRRLALPQYLGDRKVKSTLLSNKSTKASGGFLAALLYPSLVGEGCEEKEILKKGKYLVRSLDEFEKGNDVDISREKLNDLAEYFKLTGYDFGKFPKEGIAAKLFDHVNSIRDKLCFRNSISQSDSLFNAGTIKSRDVGTTIGVAHIQGIKEFIQSELDSGKYVPNIQIIYPKGTWHLEFEIKNPWEELLKQIEKSKK